MDQPTHGVTGLCVRVRHEVRGFLGLREKVFYLKHKVAGVICPPEAEFF
jgi:hypothetical protein